jgi:hypothetical protein
LVRWLLLRSVFTIPSVYISKDNRKFKKIVTPLDQTGVGALSA